MKVLSIDNSCYFYPEGINSLEEFIEYVNENINRFIPLIRLLEDNCFEPYFIESDIVKCYINLSDVHRIQEETITLLSKEEYDKRLTEVVQKVCPDCINYKEDKMGDNLSGHRTKLNLDGNCYYRTLQESEE